MADRGYGPVESAAGSLEERILAMKRTLSILHTLLFVGSFLAFPVSAADADPSEVGTCGSELICLLRLQRRIYRWCRA